jgi:predicted regulator of Ras-like GTPase activity (Roadblock/LC7/MglB family)
MVVDAEDFIVNHLHPSSREHTVQADFDAVLFNTLRRNLVQFGQHGLERMLVNDRDGKIILVSQFADAFGKLLCRKHSRVSRPYYYDIFHQ